MKSGVTYLCFWVKIFKVSHDSDTITATSVIEPAASHVPIPVLSTIETHYHKLRNRSYFILCYNREN